MVSACNSVRWHRIALSSVATVFQPTVLCEARNARLMAGRTCKDLLIYPILNDVFIEPHAYGVV